jgi:hypothetical protein
MFRILTQAILFFNGVDAKKEARYLELLGALPNFRSNVQSLLQKVNTDIEETEHKGKAVEFSNKWLSVLGISSGITGIIRDLIFNYIGRDHFHDNNGHLIQSIRNLKDFLPGEIETGEFRENLVKHYMDILRNIPKNGLPIFKEGPINDFLNELDILLKQDSIALSFVKNIEEQSDSELKILLELLDHPSYARKIGQDSGPREEEL